MDVVVPGYKIVKKIGKGGMATVYIAVQECFEREVALKIMSPILASDPVFGTRFMREARIIASLNHRNIVPVYDVGKHENLHYMAMEYLPGGDLKAKLKSGLKAEDALRIIYEVATALCYAHSKSYIHRDIKPENILFREDSSIALSDFGIAKALDVNDCNMTSTGMVVGSPHYMSPEQAQAQPIDHRADIYSLGVVLYESLVGKPLYHADSSIAAAIKHISEPIPSLPKPLAFLQPLLEKMVAKSPDERFQSAIEVTQALEPYLFSATEKWPQLANQYQADDEDETRIMSAPAAPTTISAHPTPLPTPVPQKPVQPTTRRPTVNEIVNVIKAKASQQPKLIAGVAAGCFCALLVIALYPETDTPDVNVAQSTHLTEQPLITEEIKGATAETSEIANQAVEKVAVKEKARDLAAGVTRDETRKVAQETPQQASQKAAPVVAVSTAANPSDTIVVNDVAYIDLDASEKEDIFARNAGDQLEPETKPVADPILVADTKEKIAAIADSEPVAQQEKPTESDRTPAVEDIAPTIADAADSIEELNAQPAPAAGIAVVRDPSEAINHLIALGNDALQRQRLMFPKGNSAYDRFSEVLALSPGNNEAITGLSKIVDGYLKLASKELNSGSLAEAYDHAARALSLTEKHPLPSAVTAEAANMRKTIDRVHYLEAMKNLETWNSTLRNEGSITRENLDAAYQAYRVAKESDYSDSKLDVAVELYSNAFFKLGKDYFKDDQLDISKDLIAKGLEINPKHKDLNELNDRWQRKNSGEESFFDKFYW